MIGEEPPPRGSYERLVLVADVVLVVESGVAFLVVE
jgi:hypothetical protein